MLSSCLAAQIMKVAERYIDEERLRFEAAATALNSGMEVGARWERQGGWLPVIIHPHDSARTDARTPGVLAGCGVPCGARGAGLRQGAGGGGVPSLPGLRLHLRQPPRGPSARPPPPPCGPLPPTSDDRI